MYYIQFFRTFKQNDSYRFKRDRGYGLFVDGIEFAIARVTKRDWDITEVSTGLSATPDHKTFLTRDDAISWLNNEADMSLVRSKIKQYDSIKRTLDAHRKSLEPKRPIRTTSTTLTEKQKSFLKLYGERIGAGSCATKEIAGELDLNPSTAGALMSTLIEKGIMRTYLDERTKMIEPTDTGVKLIEEVM